MSKDAKTESEVPKASLETSSAKDASWKVVPSQEDGEVSFERIDEKVLSSSPVQLSHIVHEGLLKHEAIRASSVARYSVVVPADSTREAGAEVKELIAQEEPFRDSLAFMDRTTYML